MTLAALRDACVHRVSLRGIYGVAAVLARVSRCLVTLGSSPCFSGRSACGDCRATDVDWLLDDDTIVIFDRIRENTRLAATEQPRHQLPTMQSPDSFANGHHLRIDVYLSCRDFLFGGEVLRGFCARPDDRYSCGCSLLHRGCQSGNALVGVYDRGQEGTWKGAGAKASSCGANSG